MDSYEDKAIGTATPLQQRLCMVQVHNQQGWLRTFGSRLIAQVAQVRQGKGNWEDLREYESEHSNAAAGLGLKAVVLTSLRMPHDNTVTMFSPHREENYNH